MENEEILETEAVAEETKEPREFKVKEQVESKWEKIKAFANRHKKKLIAGAVGTACVGGILYMNHLSKSIDWNELENSLPEGAEDDTIDVEGELVKEVKD